MTYKKTEWLNIHSEKNSIKKNVIVLRLKIPTALNVSYCITIAIFKICITCSIIPFESTCAHA